MMVGVPVITSEAGGAKYIVEEEKIGTIFKAGDH